MSVCSDGNLYAPPNVRGRNIVCKSFAAGLSTVVAGLTSG